jgi:hypothetical protein
MVESRAWSLWVGVWVLSATSSPNARGERLRLALVDGYEVDTLRWSELHGGLAAYLGLRLRESFTLRQFTVAVGALVEGCALRQIGADDLAPIERYSGPGGSMEHWSLFAVGLEALSHQFFELDPEWVLPDDPSGADGH